MAAQSRNRCGDPPGTHTDTECTSGHSCPSLLLATTPSAPACPGPSLALSLAPPLLLCVQRSPPLPGQPQGWTRAEGFRPPLRVDLLPPLCSVALEQATGGCTASCSSLPPARPSLSCSSAQESPVLLVPSPRLLLCSPRTCQVHPAAHHSESMCARLPGRQVHEQPAGRDPHRQPWGWALPLYWRGGRAGQWLGCVWGPACPQAGSFLPSWRVCVTRWVCDCEPSTDTEVHSLPFATLVTV